MSYFYKQNLSGWEWYEAETVTSTNDEIKNLAVGNAAVVLSAVCQTGGRGRRGRSWQPVIGNLYFTYTLDIAPKELSRVVCLIGLSLAETVIAAAPQADVKIKWPNDVFLGGKKLSGILLENLSDTHWVVGIGVNIVAAPQLSNASYAAGSLQENGIMLDRTDFLRYYLAKFAETMQAYRDKGFAPLKKRWLELALNYRGRISIKQENETKTGLFSALDDNGYLILKTETGEERIVAGDLFITKEQ